MSRIIWLTYLCAFSLSLVSSASVPPPPWLAQQRGPTSTYEVTAYIAEVTPRLDAQLRYHIEALLASNASPVYALSALQAARWRSAIASTVAPWQLAPDDGADASVHLAHNLDVLGTHLDYASAETAPLSLAETLTAMRLLDELKERVADADDPLGDLSRYTLLYRLRGAPMTIHWWAESCLRRRQFNRAENLLRFLLAPENPDGFTKGNAHHFLGHLLFFHRHDLDAAFVQFLSVPQYPACLVFSAYAYVHAADILRRINRPIHALALLAVDVPCYEYDEVAYIRHFRSARLRLRMRDYTNSIRHLQQALLSQSHHTNNVRHIYNLIPDAENLWESTATQRWSIADANAIIEHAITNRLETPDDMLFLHALSFDWPAQEDIPLHIATNRVLNNNIFPYRTRRVRGVPINRLTQGD